MRVTTVSRAHAFSAAVVVVPALTALVVGFLDVSRRSLWDDEGATLAAASGSLGQLRALLTSVDAVLGPYYAFMHVWIRVFGTSELALRLPSVIAIAATAGCVAVLGRRIDTPATGLLGGLLFALVPATTSFAHEARPYGFAALAATIAVIALDRTLQKPERLRWGAYSISIVLIGAANLVALVTVLAHGAAVAIASRDSSNGSFRTLVGPWLLAVMAAGLALSPLVILGASQASAIDWIPQPTFADLISVPAAVVGSAAFAWSLLGLGAAGLTLQAGRARVALLATWAVAPPIALFLLSGERSYFLPRYMYVVTPAIALMAGSALARLSSMRRLLVVGLLIAVSLPAQESIRSSPFHDYRSAVGAIVVAQLPGDAVLFNSGPERVLGEYYFEKAGGTSPRVLTAGDVPLALGDVKRVWIVKRTGTVDTSWTEAAKKALVQDEVLQFSGVNVLLYVRSP